ncbi:hypothetical protein LCGC14_1633370 [marine sediment metagenome]|uniref:Uncharacterized protein n=1 Tax=marine sediment metagenome TaxID=412755 RepID=A0A0F9I1Y7_9ZZZZ
MKVFIYFIEGEEENAVVIRAESWRDFAERFCIQEEIDIFAPHNNQSIKQHLSEYANWRFLSVDDSALITVHEAIIPYIE